MNADTEKVLAIAEYAESKGLRSVGEALRALCDSPYAPVEFRKRDGKPVVR